MSADNAGTVLIVILIGIADPFLAFIALVFLAKVGLGVTACRCSSQAAFPQAPAYCADPKPSALLETFIGLSLFKIPGRKNLSLLRAHYKRRGAPVGGTCFMTSKSQIVCQ
ncbi:hypothetical protein BCR43DRAFT_500332 [Syncephalastrum racemosum]|uniref:Uncharacterized protein n=1 Tax=Syncephalastrum racemosum TaxID=13706 RepID=A0A1X2HS05_SYNRA|nr:hypothetical protein BCR43DRAFT_500332 [Syncephalastrum racemosum]